jgi:phosphate transport system protein
MSTKKEQAIREINCSFQEMADLVLEQLTLVEKIMAGGKADEQDLLIIKLKQNEKKIDEFEITLSDKFINAIVLYNPVASDIRKLVAIYRMTINLERIGDLVMNIAYTTETLRYSDEYKAMSEFILNMLLSGKTMVEKSLLSFINNDTDYAVWTIMNDEVVDEMNQKLLRNTLSKARLSEKTREMLLSYADLKNIITNIERIADHATNIAEATIYSLRGTDIRHSGFDKNPDNKNIIEDPNN